MSANGLPSLPPRGRDSHKGDYGRVLVVAGSRGMVGAACLAAEAALRAGAGLVRLAVPEPLWDVAMTKLTCVMTEGLPATREGTFAETALEPLLESASWADVVAFGPGLSRVDETGRLARQFIMRLDQPLLIDADGLFHLGPLVAGSGDARALSLKSRKAPTVVTPHPGEMAHLLDTSVDEVQGDRQGTAKRFARDHGVIVVLKGAGTVVSDGERVHLNSTGNPGMASGGTGDVLTGVVAALMGQSLTPFDAAVLGVYLHGLAGDLAARDLGETSLIASDLIDYLPAAFRQVR